MGYNLLYYNIPIIFIVFKFLEFNVDTDKDKNKLM